MISICLNGNKFVMKHSMSVQDLLEYLQVPLHLVTIEYNAQLLPKNQWASVMIQANDHMEIITFVPGG
nr:thiamine biosynthesis protein S [Cyanidioschyzonaceae sp. 3]WDB00371.1 thiamine-biosynthesis [Cyanidiococcus yangmingshanensis]